MILIKKFAAPIELNELKQQAEAANLSDSEGYDTLRNPLKNEVRNLLMQEQGHLCAYCMRRIPDERISKDNPNIKDTYIEHWQARSFQHNPSDNKGLDYNNMLVVCSGNETVTMSSGKRKRRYLTCDRRRGDRALKINPLDEDTLNTIYYESDGTVRSTDKDIEADISDKLNLNCNAEAVTLPQNRKAVLDAIQKDLAEKDGDFVKNCREQLAIWENETDYKTPYIGIAIWWLRKQINSDD